MIGFVAAKITHGDTKTSEAVNASATKNNWLRHEEQEEFARLLSLTNDKDEKAKIVAYYTALSMYNIANKEFPGLESDEIIEPKLLDQLLALTANTDGGLNYTLNDLTISIFGQYQLAVYYRSELEKSHGTFQYPINNIGGFSTSFTPPTPADNRTKYVEPVTIYPSQIEGNIVKENGEYFVVGSTGDKTPVNADEVEGKRFYVAESNSWFENKEGQDVAIPPVRVVDGVEWKVDPQTGEDVYSKTLPSDYEEKDIKFDDPDLDLAKRVLKSKGIDPDDPENAKELADEFERQKEITLGGVTGSVGGVGFKSFKKLKAFLGTPGVGNQWHHIVEQAQINAKRAGFAAEEVNTVENIISLQSGKDSVHSAISGLYSSKPYWTGGLTVRDWLSTKSFEEQFQFGMNELKKYGTVAKDSVGKWIFTPFE